MTKPPTGIGMTSQRTRDRLIERLRQLGIRDELVLQAVRKVPRHAFVEEALASRAYEDTALPIGYGQTISQPYIVALMTQAVLSSGRLGKALEIGCGSGYQTAVLSVLADRVYTVERIAQLLHGARHRLQSLGYRNIEYRLADGNSGWSEHAPYDAILVTAAPAVIPEVLVAQLAPGGRMVIPVGGGEAQDLLLIKQTGNGVTHTSLQRVNFVPLVTGRN